MQRGSFKLMKKMNQKIILQIIHDQEAISRAKIAEETNLSPATVSNIVKDLLEMELVKETKRGKSRGGRKPVLLEINSEGAYVIGLEWGVSKIKSVLMDLNKSIIASREIAITSYNPDDFIDLTIELIDYLEEKIENTEKIFGIGVGVHGLVDPEQGISIYAPHFQWEDVPIREKLMNKIDYPVELDNDVRMMALAEKWGGRDNFIFINTGAGIGAALVFNQQLFYGEDWGAGEFGHMTVVDDGPVCSCGNHGCLESLISLKRLVQQYNNDLNSDISHRQLKKEWQQLIRSAASNEGQAQEIILEAGKHLGTGIANILNLLNPHSIVIGGEFLDVKDIVFPVIQEQVREKSLTVLSEKIKIEPTKFGKDVGAIGAGTKVLQKLFKLKEE